jgi:beta-glucosidase/6-phospho-beta-glucosidase/beta-galactosidase
MDDEKKVKKTMLASSEFMKALRAVAKESAVTISAAYGSGYTLQKKANNHGTR